MGEDERDRVGMTDEELKQEYLGNLEYLLSQPQLLNALGLRMGSKGRYYVYPTTVEPVKELLDQTRELSLIHIYSNMRRTKKKGDRHESDKSDRHKEYTGSHPGG